MQEKRVQDKPERPWLDDGYRYRWGFRFILYPLFLHSRNAGGVSTTAPIKKRRKVSWILSSPCPPSLRATSMVENINAEKTMHATSFFNMYDTLSCLYLISGRNPLNYIAVDIGIKEQFVFEGSNINDRIIIAFPFAPLVSLRH